MIDNHSPAFEPSYSHTNLVTLTNEPFRILPATVTKNSRHDIEIENQTSLLLHGGIHLTKSPI